MDFYNLSSFKVNIYHMASETLDRMYQEYIVVFFQVSTLNDFS